MIVDIELNTSIKHLLKEAAYFYAGKIIHSKTLNLLGITIQLSDLGSVKEYNGFTDIEGPYDYIITLNRNLGKKNLLVTLAHEMVHVKQMLKKELKHDKNGNLYWKNQLFEEHELAYLDTPWEIEAYSLEMDLYESFIKEGGLLAP